jgi:hypothetical protein
MHVAGGAGRKNLLFLKKKKQKDFSRQACVVATEDTKSIKVF